MQLDNQILTALISASVALIVAVLGSKISNGFLKFVVVLIAIGLFGFVGLVLIRPDVVCSFGFNLGDVCEESGTETLVFDFVDRADTAEWTSANGSNVLPFDGAQNDSRGFVKWRSAFRLEDGSQPAFILQTHPEWVGSGEIVGEYVLDEPIRRGDRFEALVGFIEGAGGRVTFSVEVGPRGQSVLVGSTVDSAADHQLRTFEFTFPDEVVGESVVLLIARAGSQPGQDWAVWVNAVMYGRR